MRGCVIEPSSSSPQRSVRPLRWEEFEATYRVAVANIPEAELREEQQPTSDGHVGPSIDHDSVFHAILAGLQKHTEIKAPVLAIFAGPQEVGPFAHNDPALEKFNAYDADRVKRVSEGFQKGVPSARVVVLPHANHFMFLSNEADVLREMRTFLAGLH